ncbi:HNH endonuclease [Microbulbifer yueqingensis]|uniref:5-methylcytosine-specific restriction enzyme A n=1 Tax=Microbulbifer yueqingensis TaxID=658219 RepID=A0A1G9EJY4_9GAMM|nr:HNH endonuclease signature motif containing protein [Microbulbifer yueqingensis]SDK76446.1 5-methylcytosine-specific restriction enzyme A [Microbulbifer yueqingensis]
MSENWTEEELKASVDVYVEMHRRESSAQAFTKKSYYEMLANRFGRTPKSYEYRMQNISYVYALQGRRWISGLKPARNVGANVIRVLERLIADSEGQHIGSSAAFEASVEKLRKNPPSLPPKGNKKPPATQSSVTQFVRDPEVVAWVLATAAGNCECCGNPAPFMREDGSPFLEVHHVERLADGGEDTINNAAALCPNCHRQLHYGAQKQKLAQELRRKISRLRLTTS